MEGIRRATCTALSLFGLLIMPTATSGGIINGNIDGLGQFENALATTNWAGYIVPTGIGKASAASAGWTVPKAERHNGQAGDASSWVGIGGFSARTLIQAGTQSDVDAAGNATYFAWWEKVPDTQPARVVKLNVHPGDRMRVSLLETSPGVWRISIVDRSTEHSFSTTTNFASSKDSAEWIVERPLFVDAAGHRSLTELPQLDQAGFHGARLNGAKVKLPLAFQIHMLNNAHNGVEAFTSVPGSDGNSFAVCPYSNTCAAPAPRHGDREDNDDHQGDQQDDLED